MHIKYICETGAHLDNFRIALTSSRRHPLYRDKDLEFASPCLHLVVHSFGSRCHRPRSSRMHAGPSSSRICFILCVLILCPTAASSIRSAAQPPDLYRGDSHLSTCASAKSSYFWGIHPCKWPVAIQEATQVCRRRIRTPLGLRCYTCSRHS